MTQTVDQFRLVKLINWPIPRDSQDFIPNEQTVNWIHLVWPSGRQFNLDSDLPVFFINMGVWVSLRSPRLIP